MPALSPEELRFSYQELDQNNVTPPENIVLAKKHKTTDKNKKEEENDKTISEKKIINEDVCDEGTDRKMSPEELREFHEKGQHTDLSTENIVLANENKKNRRKQ